MTDTLTSEQKVEVLLRALDERYKALHVIRERVQSVCLWTLGILFGAGGWLIQSGVSLGITQKVVFMLGLISVFVILRFYYLADLEEGFRGQQRVAARLENALGLFAVNVYDALSEGVYPSAWKDGGAIAGAGKFFQGSYLLLYSGFAFLSVSVLLSGCVT